MTCEYHAAFVYDSVLGVVQYRKTGRIVAHVNKRGYVIASYKGRNIGAHRLAWFLSQGTWPLEIDHVNGIKHDNRLCNLRLCSRSQNIANARQRSNSKQPYKGVARSRKRWIAQIQIRGVRYCLGSFDTAEEAAAAYAKAGQAGFGEFHRC